MSVPTPVQRPSIAAQSSSSSSSIVLHPRPSHLIHTDRSHVAGAATPPGPSAQIPMPPASAPPVSSSFPPMLKSRLSEELGLEAPRNGSASAAGSVTGKEGGVEKKPKACLGCRRSKVSVGRPGFLAGHQTSSSPKADTIDTLPELHSIDVYPPRTQVDVAYVASNATRNASSRRGYM
jgi:hypothetical protein